MLFCIYTFPQNQSNLPHTRDNYILRITIMGLRGTYIAVIQDMKWKCDEIINEITRKDNLSANLVIRYDHVDLPTADIRDWMRTDWEFRRKSQGGEQSLYRICLLRMIWLGTIQIIIYKHLFSLYWILFSVNSKLDRQHSCYLLLWKLISKSPMVSTFPGF